MGHFPQTLTRRSFQGDKIEIQSSLNPAQASYQHSHNLPLICNKFHKRQCQFWNSRVRLQCSKLGQINKIKYDNHINQYWNWNLMKWWCLGTSWGGRGTDGQTDRPRWVKCRVAVCNKKFLTSDWSEIECECDWHGDHQVESYTCYNYI